MRLLLSLFARGKKKKCMWLSVKRLKFTGAALGCKSFFFTGRNEKGKKKKYIVWSF